jgi:rod shape-determining protein MreB
MFETKIGIDLGTANILVCVKNKGIVINEPSLVARDSKTKKVIAFGRDAKEMLGREPANIEIIKPITLGVISDFSMTEQMLKYYINKVKGGYMSRLNVLICVPSGVSEVERRAVEDTAYGAGARKISIIDEPIAAAVGAGIDIYEPYGRMVVDIGGGTTDVAVISLNGIVLSESLKVAGDHFDQALINYIRRVYNVVIGQATAEKIKKEVGSVTIRPELVDVTITGRDLVTGLPKSLTITSSDTIPVLTEIANRIIDTVYSILEKTPPEMAADIIKDGILLTGGGSLVHGIDELIEKRLGLDVVKAPDSLGAVALGLLSMM